MPEARIRKEVVLVDYSREEIVKNLRRLGYPQQAEEASRVLPDRVDLKQLEEFGDQQGIFYDDLISRSGGSP
jgi:hypothetical protein